MKTFKQYINEGFLDKALGTALTFGAIGAGAAGLKMMASQPEQQATRTTQPTIAAKPTLVPKQPVVQEKEKEKEKPKVDPAQVKHEKFMAGLANKHGDEHQVILNAAKRNGITENDHETLSMLYAIRKTENGKPGKEFGVLSPGAVGKPGQTLDKQAGWAASILMERKAEWQGMNPKEQGKYQGFPHYLQSKYSPVGAKNDPKGLNKNWLTNFTTHYNENMGFENDQ
jgi:hypothetical protein